MKKCMLLMCALSFFSAYSYAQQTVPVVSGPPSQSQSQIYIPLQTMPQTPEFLQPIPAPEPKEKKESGWWAQLRKIIRQEIRRFHLDKAAEELRKAAMAVGSEMGTAALDLGRFAGEEAAAVTREVGQEVIRGAAEVAREKGKEFSADIQATTAQVIDDTLSGTRKALEQVREGSTQLRAAVDASKEKIREEAGEMTAQEGLAQVEPEPIIDSENLVEPESKNVQPEGSDPLVGGAPDEEP